MSIFFNSKKGASLVLVLALIMVLMALGTMAVTLSTAGIQMGGRYRDRINEFYRLDGQAENGKASIDFLLSQAEKYSTKYMNNEYYKTSGAAIVVEPGAVPVDLDTQGRIYGVWNNLVFKPCEYKIEQNGNLLPGFDENLYRDNLGSFIPSAVKRLYLYYSYRLLSDNGYLPIIQDSTITDYADAIFTSGNSSLTAWKQDLPQGTNIKVAKEFTYPGSSKKLSVLLRVTQPEYSYLPQVRNIPVKGNPAWMNAVSAQNNIRFTGSGTVSIKGDVLSADAGTVDGSSDDTIPEGNLGGIAVESGTVNINGNVYSRGDIHITGSNSALNIGKYSPGTSISRKIELFDTLSGIETATTFSGILFDNNIFNFSFLKKYIKGSSTGDFPFIYKDNEGGNVYCNNLSVEKNANQNGFINLTSPDGVLWTFDDVQMDGRASAIDVQSNYVGIRSDANEFQDPNASSCVINNENSSSIIRLKGSLIVPGTAFITFDDSSLGPLHKNYQTAESITAHMDETFAKYVYNPGDSGSYNRFSLNTSSGAIDFFLKDFNSDFNLKRQALLGISPPPNAQIETMKNPKGYTLGVVNAYNRDGALKEYYIKRIESESVSDYTAVSSALKDIFKAKTVNFGTAGKSFRHLLNPVIPHTSSYYSAVAFGSDGTKTVLSSVSPDTMGLTLNGSFSGVVYCYGKNLQISGSGEFKGTVICQAKEAGGISGGRITIDSGMSGNAITIQYDEDAIIKAIQKSDDCLKLFNPGEMGNSMFFVTKTGIGMPGAGERKVKKRFKIERWEEGNT